MNDHTTFEKSDNSGKTKSPNFQPGFRLSVFDTIILIIGIAGSILLGSVAWWFGAIVAFVVLHFFLFCNVFRISRPPELIWGAIFLATAAATILTERPGWIATFSIAIAVSTYLIWRETKRKHYHGIYWQSWNPDLVSWWDARENKDL